MKRFLLVLVAILIAATTSEASSVYSSDGGLTFWHHIKPGESLTELAQDYAPNFTPNPVRQLKKLNGLVNDRIYAGDDLQIPTEWIRPHVPYVPTPTPTKETMTMPFDSSLFLTLLFLVFILFVLGMIMYFLGRRPHNHHHCNCGNAHYPYCLPAPAPVLTVPPITINPIRMTVDHTFQSGGLPLSVTMATPVTVTTTQPPTPTP